jgi:hypothetical protein
MEWVVADMTDMSEMYADCAFDVVIEKCTFDAFLANERSQWEMEEETAEKVDSALKVLSFVYSVFATCHCYFCATYVKW